MAGKGTGGGTGVGGGGVRELGNEAVGQPVDEAAWGTAVWYLSQLAEGGQGAPTLGEVRAASCFSSLASGGKEEPSPPPIAPRCAGPATVCASRAGAGAGGCPGPGRGVRIPAGPIYGGGSGPARRFGDSHSGAGVSGRSH